MEASSSSSSSGGSALWGLLPLPPGGFMADARRAPVSRLRSQVVVPPSSLVVPPPASPPAPEPGWEPAARRRRRPRRAGPPPPPPPRSPGPVSEDLLSRCFNCLSSDHFARDCSSAPRCLRCKAEGHRAGDCKRPRSPMGVVDAPLQRRRVNPATGPAHAHRLAAGLAQGAAQSRVVRTPAPPVGCAPRVVSRASPPPPSVPPWGPGVRQSACVLSD